MTALQAVIFDMDGVLTDSEPFILEAAQTHLRRRYGIEVPQEDFEEFIGAGDDAFVGGPARKHGVEPELPADKLATYAIYDEIIVGRLQALPGVLAFVDQVQQAGRRIAVASSADRQKVEANLREIGLPLDRFDAIVSADDVERKKPDPAAFLLAAERVGVAAAHCLVIEDAVNGVQAAKAAGAVCLGVAGSFPAERLQAAGADHVVDNLTMVPAALLDRLR